MFLTNHSSAFLLHDVRVVKNVAYLIPLLIIFVSPAPDVTNLFQHKLAYSDFFKMADGSRKFYDISEQLNAINN